MPLAQLKYGSGCRSSRLTCAVYPLEKELNPPFPVTVVANGHEPVVILLPMGLEVVAQVQEWPIEHAAFAKQQRDEEAPDTSVAVEERMNRLELCVREGAVDQSW